MLQRQVSKSFSGTRSCFTQMRGRGSVAIIAAALAGLGFSPLASADALPGEVLKFYQAPLNNLGPQYPLGAVPTSLDVPASPRSTGHDELSTATFSTAANGGYTGTMMADDFGDTFTTPIVHVTFWGSYMNNTAPPTGAAGVQKFQITFYTDNPANKTANTPSTPLIPYSTQTVTLGALAPASGTFTETPVINTSGSPNTGDSPLFKYNAELAIPVTEPVTVNPTTGQVVQGPIGTVNWISIVALSGGPNGGPTFQWGWHDRDYGIFDPLAIGANPTGPGENNLNPALTDPNGQPVWHFQDDAVSNNTFAFTPGALPTAAPNGSGRVSSSVSFASPPSGPSHHAVAAGHVARDRSRSTLELLCDAFRQGRAAARE